MKIPGFSKETGELLGITPDNYSELGRIVAEHKERYILQTSEETLNAEITGNIRYSAQSRADFPAVGDWVRFTKIDDNSAIIIELYPRYSVLGRQAVGKFGEVQIIGTNIDCAFIVQAVGYDFNLKRLERYLTLCHSAKIVPLVLLTKVDLISKQETQELTRSIEEKNPGIKIIALSSVNNTGYDQLLEFMEVNKTYCFIGSSGVGKSTIINHLKGEELLKTAEVSTSNLKGKHTTSHRELFILPNKSIVIDTPGMREVGITEENHGIDVTYGKIEDLAQHCRFTNCSHTSEDGCAVLEAMENGELPEATFNNFHKLKREQEHFSSTVHEKRKKGKEFGKHIKAVLQEKKRYKY